MKKRYIGVGIGSFIVTVVLFLTMVAPIFDRRFDVLDIYSEQKKADTLTSDIPIPYIYEPHNYPGGMSRWIVNETYFLKWLDETVTWVVQKSTDNLAWKDYSKFEVKKDWNSETQQMKYTVIVTSDQDAYYRVITNTNKDKQLTSYEDRSVIGDIESRTNDFVMDFRVADSSYKISYNWDDYLKSDAARTSTFSKSVTSDISNKQSFNWNVVSNAKIKSGATYTIDPTYGLIADAVVDSWEYDQQEGDAVSPKTLIKLGDSEYYAMVIAGDTGSDYDGFLRTFQVNDSDGKFTTKTLISTWEYDTTDGYFAGILHISGDVYAIYYSDSTASKCIIITTTIYSTNGTAQKNTLDTFNADMRSANYPNLVHVIDDIYALVYAEATSSSGNYYMETLSITAGGVMPADAIDTEIFDIESITINMGTGLPSAVMVDNDTIAITYYRAKDYDAWMITYNISDAGAITNDPSDSWEFYTGGTASGDEPRPFIHKINNNIFAVAYQDTDDDGQVGTIQIDDAGDISNGAGSEAFIDTLEWADADTIDYPVIFTVNDASTIPGGQGVYGIHYMDSGNDGHICTINISSAGNIDASIIDHIEYDATTVFIYPGVVHASGDSYIFAYQGQSDDGYVATINITTAVSAGESWQIISNTINGTIYNNTGNWNMISSNINGSIYNNTGSWNIISDTINGTIYNNTGNWNMISSNINGSIYNNTGSWKTISTDINGSIYNSSSWKTISTNINGSIYNTTAQWKVISDTINGSIYNNTGSWRIVSDTINGSIYNSSGSWNIISDTINGSIYNSSSWKTISTDINGSIYNSTGVWNIISDTINGTIYNNTGNWNMISSNINGSIYNNTGSWDIISDTINGSIYNTSSWKAFSTTINGSIYNLSSFNLIDGTINGSIFNASYAGPANITLSSPSPNDTVVRIRINTTYVSGHTTDIIVSITRNHATGNLMNTTIWFNNTYLFTNTSWGNGTISFYLFDYWSGTLQSNQLYNWTVNCTDETEAINKTYNFTPRIVKSSFMLIGERNIMVSVAIGSILSIVLGLVWKQRKKKQFYD